MLTSSEIKSLAKHSARELAPELSKEVANEFKKCNDTIITIVEVAKMLNKTKQAVRMMCSRKQIPYYKHKRRVYFSKNEVTNLIFGEK